jgi:hypothetical protein
MSQELPFHLSFSNSNQRCIITLAPDTADSGQPLVLYMNLHPYLC